MVDKKYCMSTYLAFRFIPDENVNFYEGIAHKNYKEMDDSEKTVVNNEYDVDKALASCFSGISNKKLALLLSGGMDSAILASYMSGHDAYTFRFEGGFQHEELMRAEYYARKYNLNLHYVDINFEKVNSVLPEIMKHKGAPVHSIEPQLYLAAKQIKDDKKNMIIIGNDSDTVFGGSDKLLSKDWKFDEFVDRFTFLQPYKVLKDPYDIREIYEKYRTGDDDIDYMSFLGDIFDIESNSSYENPFELASMPYIDPYSSMKLGIPLDIERIRKGDSKYIIRALFKMKYPEMQIPEKLPMPRPVDAYFKNWKGPKRYEFRDDIDISEFTGNQKWQLYCLESFLDLFNC